MAKKTVQSNTIVSTSSTTIGVDLGYGDVKGANSVNTMLMPSVIGAAPAGGSTRYADEWTRDDGDTVWDDEGTWFIGEKALMHSRKVRYIKDRQRTLMPDYKRLLFTAFGQLHPHNGTDTDVTHINVATGLPVAHMDDADGLRELLLKEHRVHTQHANGIYSVENVAIMPQPYGTLFAMTLNDDGALTNKELSESRALVIDVGRYTTNVVTVDEMAYMDYASSSIDSGVSVIEEHLQRHFEKEYQWADVRPDILRGIILNKNHHATIEGESISFKDVFEEGANDLAEQVIGLVMELVGQGRDVQHIIVTGGGGIILEDYIKERYSRARLADNAVMANAIGFARYGRRKWVK